MSIPPISTLIQTIIDHSQECSENEKRILSSVLPEESSQSNNLPPLLSLNLDPVPLFFLKFPPVNLTHSQSHDAETIVVFRDSFKEPVAFLPPIDPPTRAKEVRTCMNCGTTKTVQWYRGPEEKNTQRILSSVLPEESSENKDLPPLLSLNLDPVPLSFPNLPSVNLMHSRSHDAEITMVSRDSIREPVAFPPPIDPPTRAKEVRTCLNCGTTKTVQWRRGPEGKNTLCNPCGIRYKKERNSEKRNF